MIILRKGSDDGIIIIVYFIFKWGLIEYGKGRFLKAINAFARNVSLTFSNLTIITYRNHALN